VAGGEAGINGNSLRRNAVPTDAIKQLSTAVDRLRTLPLVFCDTPSQTVTRIAARARRLMRKGGLGMLAIDYLQLIEPENRRDPRHEQVAQISRRLKLLARELKIPVMVLAQLNRESENRSDRRPRLADLRESGSLEQDADTVLLLHRSNERPADLEVIIAKQRNGPTGEIVLQYDRRTGRISDKASRGFPD
jgi:replicative DNA helicase